jgi:hypothetical protein
LPASGACEVGSLQRQLPIPAMVWVISALMVVGSAGTAGATLREYPDRVSLTPLRGLEITSGPCMGLIGAPESLKRQRGCVIEQALRTTMSGNPLFADSRQGAVHLACLKWSPRAD